MFTFREFCRLVMVGGLLMWLAAVLSRVLGLESLFANYFDSLIGVILFGSGLVAFAVVRSTEPSSTPATPQVPKAPAGPKPPPPKDPYAGSKIRI